MAPAPPLLYSYRRCPYAMRARMALLAIGLKLQLLRMEQRTPALIACKKLGTP